MTIDAEEKNTSSLPVEVWTWADTMEISMNISEENKNKTAIH